jgi:hypothetical protein
MDVEFEFKGFKSVDRLADLQSTLAAMRGVMSVEFIAERLAVRYDPEDITGADIRDLIHQAGFEVASEENAPLAPPIESAQSAAVFEGPAD